MRKLSKKMTSIIIAILLSIVVIFLLSYFFNAENIVFTSASITATPDNVEIGEYFDINMTIGTASSENVPKTSFTIFINNKNIELVNFLNGNYHTTLPSGEVVTYTLENKDDGIYITTNELTNGDTIQLNLRAKFKEDTTKNGETAHIIINGNNQELASTDVSAYCDLNWQDEKNGPSDIKIINDNTIKMTGTNTYTIKQYPKQESNIEDENAKLIKMSDTIILPKGMTFLSTTDEDIIIALGLNSIKDKNLSIDATETSATFTWEDNIQNTYEFTLNNDSFVFDDNFVESDIKNTLTTTIITQADSEKQLPSKEVITHLNIVTQEDYIKDFKKEIIDTNTYSLAKDGSWGYLLQNDIVLYKISFTNNSDSIKDYSLKDIIPNGMTTISEEEIFNTNYPKPIGDSKNSEISIEGNNITWNIKSVEPDEKVEAYIYLKANINENTTLINTAYLEDMESSVSVELRKESNLNIEKTADYDGTKKGKEFTYTIKIYNPNHTKLFGKEIKDNIPDCLEIMSTEVDWCSNNSNSGNIITNGNNINITDIEIAAYETISYKIHVKIKDDYNGDDFSNTAYVYSNGEETSSTWKNTGEDKLTIEKTASETTVFPNDEFSYTIKIYNGNSDDKDYSEKEGIFQDTIDDNFEIEDVYYILNEEKNTDGLTIDENTINLSFNGIIKAHETLEIKILCKVKNNARAQSITNTAYFDDKQASVDITISNESNNLSVEKTAFHQDGTPVENNKVEKGETVLFNVKVSNLSKTSSIKRISLKDNFLGDFKKVDIPNGIMKVTVIDSSNVNGFVDTGTILDKHNAWTTDLRWSDTRFIISSKYEYDALYYNDDFEILPNGYITLQYEAIIGDLFTDGTNEIILNDEFKDEVYLSTLDTPLIEIKKTTDIHNYSVEQLKNLEIPYTITIYNMSNFDGYFQHFTVTDTLPDGLEFVGRWWGNTDPWIEVYYQGQNLWDWSYDRKGGHFYPKVNGNTLSIEFGSSDENGKQNLINFNKGEKIEIKVKCKFTEEKIKELEQKENYTYPYESFTNNVILTADDKFKDLDGNIVNSLEATETINVVPIVPSPGIEKQFIGSYTGDNTNKISDVPSVGDNLIWKIIVKNTNDDGPCGNLTDFKVSDIMPENYLYNENYENKMYITSGENIKEIKYIEPEIKDGSIEWNFDDIILKKDETLTIEVCMKNDGTNKYSILINTARLITKEKIENISSGEKIDDYTIEDTAQTSTLLYKTSSYETIDYTPCGNHRNDPDADIGYGYMSSPNNKIQAKQGETITYKLYLKNDSNSSLHNIYFIDRLSYIGDSSPVSNYNRNSAFNIEYGELISAVIYDSNDNPISDVTSEAKVSFSNTKNAIKDNAKDWIGENDIGEWHDNYQEDDINIRFDLSTITIPSQNYIVLSFTGIIPEYVSEMGQNNVAWNNFAYSYTTDGEHIMVAEPSKVGAWVNGTKDNGKISLTKKVSSDKTEKRTFYFALFKKIDDQYEKFSTIQKVEVEDEETIEFNNLPYDIYYVFEVDENGNIINSTDIIGQGQEVIVEDDSDNNIIVENIITNKKANFKLIKFDDSNRDIKLEGAVFELSNNENTYEITTDKNGEAYIENIEFGTYSLIETKAPEGYVLLSTPIQIDITLDSLTDGTYICNVSNIKQMYMPATGSNGKIIYLPTGIFIVLIILIIYKKSLQKN